MIKLKKLMSEGVIWKKADPDKYYRVISFGDKETNIIKSHKYKPKLNVLHIFNYEFEYVDNIEDNMTLYIYLGKYNTDSKNLTTDKVLYGFTVELHDHDTDSHKTLEHGITKPFAKEDLRVLKSLLDEIFKKYGWGIKK